MIAFFFKHEQELHQIINCEDTCRYLNEQTGSPSLFLFFQSMRLDWQLLFQSDINILIILFKLNAFCTLHISKFVSISNGQIFVATPVFLNKYVSIILNMLMLMMQSRASIFHPGLLFNEFCYAANITLYDDLIFQWKRLTSIFFLQNNDDWFLVRTALIHYIWLSSSYLAIYSCIFDEVKWYWWWSGIINLKIERETCDTCASIFDEPFINNKQSVGKYSYECGIFSTNAFIRYKIIFIFYCSFSINWLLLLMSNVIRSFVFNGIADKTNGWLLKQNKFLWFLNCIVDLGLSVGMPVKNESQMSEESYLEILILKKSWSG